MTLTEIESVRNSLSYPILNEAMQFLGGDSPAGTADLFVTRLISLICPLTTKPETRDTSSKETVPLKRDSHLKISDRKVVDACA